jgi:hypothetical protein
MEQTGARNDPAPTGATASGALRRWFAPAEWSGAFGDLEGGQVPKAGFRQGA